MKRLLLTICMGLSLNSLTAQENDNPTFNYLKYRNSKFYEASDIDHRGKRIKGDALRSMLIETDAFDSWQLHKTFKGLTWGFGGVGLVILGVSLYQTLESDGYYYDDNLTNYALGTMILAELPCAILTGVFGRKTAKIHNKYAAKQNEKYSLHFGAARHGIGLTFKF